MLMNSQLVIRLSTHQLILAEVVADLLRLSEVDLAEAHRFASVGVTGQPCILMAIMVSGHVVQ